MAISRRHFLVAASATVVSAACAPSAPAAPPAATQKAPPTSIEPTVASGLKIGVLLPYTEQAIGSDVGISQKHAADLYLKQHGGKLGGREAAVIYADESIDLARNQLKIRQFLDTDKVNVLIGAVAAETAYALRDAAEAANLLYIDTGATTNDLTRGRKSKLVFRTSASNWQLSEPLGEWASRNGQKEFVLAVSDDPTGTESADAFLQGLQKNGGSATARMPTGPGDIPKLMAAIKAQPTRNVFAAFETDDAEAFLKAWDQSGMRAAGYRLHGPGPLAEVGVLNATKAAAAGTITSHFWSADLDNAENKTLIDLFQKTYKTEDTGEPALPDGYAVGMWDALRALDDALGTSKGDAKDPNTVIASLEAVSFRSPRGDFAFDKSSHNPIQAIYIRETRVANGKAVNTVTDTIARVADVGT